MARQINLIACVCGFLSNFHPALVPFPETIPDMPNDASDEIYSGEDY